MIVLDTNVISELWKVEPNPRVLAWIDAQAIETLYLSVFTVAELRYGLATMPQGKRRSIYQERLDRRQKWMRRWK
jgi:predicted nucleic acid-binding protein